MNKNELIVLKNPKSPISETFRTLRTNIQFMNTTQNAKTILITSAFANEGKSWISSNLAIAFAQTEKKSAINRCRHEKRKTIINFQHNTITRSFKLFIK